MNRITNQEVSLVSEVMGTTTDPVRKSMELLPLGPVTLIDTPGFDDVGALGTQRVRRTREILNLCDIAVLVTDHDILTETETELKRLIEEREVPCVIVRSKTDLLQESRPDGKTDTKADAEASDGGSDEAGAAQGIRVSTEDGTGIEALKEELGRLLKGREKTVRFVADLIQPGDTVVLVIPIDTSAPKGRIILPQQLAIRDILEAGAFSMVTGVEDLPKAIAGLAKPPALVITDSQAFGRVSELLPEAVPLTSFSILMARYKGFLEQAVAGADMLDRLPEHTRILISEGCTHHRQCEDIGTVKLPKWIRAYTGKSPDFAFTSGHGFPEKLTGYDLIIHCGGCMLTDREVQGRMRQARREGVPFTNYGMVIAKMNHILERSLEPL